MSQLNEGSMWTTQITRFPFLPSVMKSESLGSELTGATFRREHGHQTQLKNPRNQENLLPFRCRLFSVVILILHQGTQPGRFQLSSQNVTNLKKVSLNNSWPAVKGEKGTVCKQLSNIHFWRWS
jgi:hypothetical protein